MKGLEGNGFVPIIAQAIAEMEETHGEFKSVDEINLAELSRRTGLIQVPLILHVRKGKPADMSRGGWPAYEASQLAALPVSPLAPHRARPCAASEASCKP